MSKFGGLLIFVAVLATRLAGATEFHSGPGQVALLELYTSEGCSSCPPAERWLGELRHDPDLWVKFVPVAFHVNYWDRLGWRDALATKQFTQREYAHAEAWGAGNVYTPCFVRNGAEWRPRRDPGGEPGSATAGLLTATWRPGGMCLITYTPAPGRPAGVLVVNVALLGGGIVSRVKAGENSGRELTHEFVALSHATSGLQASAAGLLTAEVAVGPPANRDLPPIVRHAIAVWVTVQGSLASLQATGGWID